MKTAFKNGLAIVTLSLCAIGIAYPQQSEQKTTTQAKPRLTWQHIGSNGGIGTDFQVLRAKIPGGWLVTTGFTENRAKNTVSGGNGTTFVPDPDHRWDGSSLD